MPARRWARLGVDVRLETPIEQIDATGIVARGERIEAATVVWCAGVRATPVGRWLGVPTERAGTVRVEADLSVPGQDRIFVLGDAADRKTVVEGKSVSVRVDLGGGSIIKKINK